MSRTVTSQELYEEIEHGSVPMILDVRNQDEFAAWRVEGNKPVPTRNVPIWLAVEDIEALAKEDHFPPPQRTVGEAAQRHGANAVQLLAALNQAAAGEPDSAFIAAMKRKYADFEGGCCGGHAH